MTGNIIQILQILSKRIYRNQITPWPFRSNRRFDPLISLVEIAKPPV